MQGINGNGYDLRIQFILLSQNSIHNSDVVHDLLAFLAERMLEMKKQKLAWRSKASWAGWKASPGARVVDLTPKTKRQGYYEHHCEGFPAVLKKKRKKMYVDQVRREPGEALKAEFQGSVGKLAPLRWRIRQTDELIDAVVYRLYLLTEDEIRIVEGNAHYNEWSIIIRCTKTNNY